MNEVELVNLDEEKPVAKQIFTRKKSDKYVILSLLFTTFAVWTFLIIKGKLSNILTHAESAAIVYNAKNFYQQPPEYFFQAIGSNVPNASNADIYLVRIGTPLVLSILRICTFGYWLPAAIIYILATNIICFLLFERFLSIWRIVQNPTLTACCLAIFPAKMLLIHTTLNSDTVFLSCLFVSLIGYKIHKFKVILYAIFVASLFDRQCIALTFGFFITFFAIGRYSEALKICFSNLLGTIIVSLIQFLRCGDFFALIKRSYINAPDFQLFPFGYFLTNMMSIMTMELFHVEWILFGFSVIGIVLLSRISRLMIILPCSILVYVSMFRCLDIMRHAYALEILCILVGFDQFINSPNFKKGIKFYACVYGFGAFIIAVKMIQGSALYNEGQFWNMI